MPMVAAPISCPSASAGIDRKTDIADGGEFLHGDFAGFLIDGDFNAGSGSFPEDRQGRELAGLSNVGPADHFTVGKRIKFADHLRPVELGFAAAHAAANSLDLFVFHFEHVGGHDDHLLDRFSAGFQDRAAHQRRRPARAGGSVVGRDRGVG